MRLTDRPYYKQPWYNSYRSMMDRCYRKGAANYRQYGGRGIEVCEEWQDIENFAIWCEASGYSNGLTIERIDVNGNYSPINCRWATYKEQANNTRSNLLLTFGNETHTASEWADIYGVDVKKIYNRKANGWNEEQLYKWLESQTGRHFDIGSILKEMNDEP